MSTDIKDKMKKILGDISEGVVTLEFNCTPTEAKELLEFYQKLRAAQ